MNADCLRAQAAISHAADGDRVTADDAAWAKRHCAGCAECTTYVRTLAQLRTVSHPKVPEETIARTVDAVTKLIEVDRLAAETAAASDLIAEDVSPLPSLSSDSDLPADIATDSGGQVTPLPRRKVSTASMITWGVSAAAVLFVAMFVAGQGLRTINNPQGDRSFDDAPVYLSGDKDVAGSQTPQAESAPTADIPLPAPGFIVFEDSVYGFLGIVDESIDDYSKLGTARTALDSGGTPQQRSVYGEEPPNRIMIEANGVYAFALITRSLDGVVFAQRSDSLEAFGEWPKMPSSVPTPDEQDGSPVFEVAGRSGGVSIYTSSGRNPEEGFAVAPNSPTNDPAQSSPEWTWWEPQD